MPLGSLPELVVGRAALKMQTAGPSLRKTVAVTSGKRLWQWPTGQVWRSSPMTYMFDGKQFVATAVGANIMAFGLVPSRN